MAQEGASTGFPVMDSACVDLDLLGYLELKKAEIKSALSDMVPNRK